METVKLVQFILGIHIYIYIYKYIIKRNMLHAVTDLKEKEKNLQFCSLNVSISRLYEYLSRKMAKNGEIIKFQKHLSLQSDDRYINWPRFKICNKKITILSSTQLKN